MKISDISYAGRSERFRWMITENYMENSRWFQWSCLMVFLQRRSRDGDQIRLKFSFQLFGLLVKIDRNLLLEKYQESHRNCLKISIKSCWIRMLPPKITLPKLSGIFIRFKLNLFVFEVTEVPDNYDGDSKQFLRSFMSIKVGFPTKEVPNDCNSDFEELWQKFVTIPTKGNLDVCNDWDNCD